MKLKILCFTFGFRQGVNVNIRYRGTGIVAHSMSVGFDLKNGCGEFKEWRGKEWPMDTALLSYYSE